MPQMSADLKSSKIICVNLRHLRFRPRGLGCCSLQIFYILVAPAVFPVTVRLDLRGRADFW